MTETTLVWFRQDLRLDDNPALYHACQQGSIIPVYILDTTSDFPARDSAAAWWLQQSLLALSASLDEKLIILNGNPETLLPDLMSVFQCQHITWNRCYEGWRVERDSRLKTALKDRGYTVKSFNGSLLWEPWQTKKQDDDYYRVFTPFYRHVRSQLEVSQPLPSPASLDMAALPDPAVMPGDHECRLTERLGKQAIQRLPLLFSIGWEEKLHQHWNISERDASQQLETFLNETLGSYETGRDVPAENATSLLSPYLQAGLISPQRIWQTTQSYALTAGKENAAEAFLRELIWREFAFCQLYRLPDLATEPVNDKFRHFPWQRSGAQQKQWQRGATGIPLVDAGMRELWETGYMHNRVRMVAASFLVKNLLQPWQDGRAWFDNCLVDACPANNNMNWQWVAGCGIDAAPYFRIFNPVRQSQRFDPRGDYIRRWVPELASLPSKHIHEPWSIPEQVAREICFTPGKDYPSPMVNLKDSRERALQAFRTLPKSSSA